MNESTFERSLHDKKNPYVMLSVEIIQSPYLCLEGIGCYGMLESRTMKWEDVPFDLKEDLIKAGYIPEVEE